MTASFERACEVEAFPEDGKLALRLKGWAILICRIDGAYRAVVNRCTHAASTLQDGRIRRGAIICPLHGAMFNLADGHCVGGGYQPLKTFETRLVDGWIEVLTPDDPPAAEHMPVSPIA